MPFQHCFQYQVLKPQPANVLDLYLDSLRAIGLDKERPDIPLSRTTGSNPQSARGGLGSEVWCDGMEITQFSYFQQFGGSTSSALRLLTGSIPSR